jgi:hypothetical protein
VRRGLTRLTRVVAHRLGQRVDQQTRITRRRGQSSHQQQARPLGEGCRGFVDPAALDGAVPCLLPPEITAIWRDDPELTCEPVDLFGGVTGINLPARTASGVAKQGPNALACCVRKKQSVRRRVFARISVGWQAEFAEDAVDDPFINTRPWRPSER